MVEEPIPLLIFMRIAFITFLIAFAFQTKAQTEASIHHYQKKLKMESSELFMPCEDYRSELFSTHIPANLYSSGDVYIEKLRTSDGLKMSCKFKFEQNTISEVIYVVKLKKRDQLELLDQRMKKSSSNNCQIEFVGTIKKKHFYSQYKRIN